MAPMNARPTDPQCPPSVTNPPLSGADEFSGPREALALAGAYAGQPLSTTGAAGTAVRWVAAFATLMERLDALAEALDQPDEQRARQCLQQAARLAQAAPEFVRALPLYVDPRSGPGVGRWAGDLPGARPFRPGQAAVPPVRNDQGRPPHRALSARELEVLSRVAAGLSNKQIARELLLSPHTVKRHVARICDTLGCRSRTAAAAWYARTRRDVAGPSGPVTVDG